MEAHQALHHEAHALNLHACKCVEAGSRRPIRHSVMKRTPSTCTQSGEQHEGERACSMKGSGSQQGARAWGRGGMV